MKSHASDTGKRHVNKCVRRVVECLDLPSNDSIKLVTRKQQFESQESSVSRDVS